MKATSYYLVFLLSFLCFVNAKFPWQWTYTTQIIASKHNTLYELPEDAPPMSDGIGPTFIVGVTAAKGNYTIRRGLIQFDVKALWNTLPTGAEAFNVEVQLTVRKSAFHPAIISLFPVSSSWGAEGSNATDAPGVGAPAQKGDATWYWSKLNITRWTIPGGDFVENVNVSVNVSSYTTYSWAGETVFNIVKNWVSQPDANNNGWLVKMLNDNETEARSSAKEFYGIHPPSPNIVWFPPKIVLHYKSDPPIWFWIVTALSGAVILAGTSFGILKCRQRQKSYTYTTIRDIESIVRPGHGKDKVIKLFKDPSIRVILSSDIELGTVLGVGGFGAVYKAIIKSTRQEVAVKKMHLAVSINEETEDMLTDFIEEIRIMSTVAHPNVLSLVGISFESETSSEVMLITEIMPLGSLADIITKKNYQLSYTQKIKIASEISYGMHYLHSVRPRIIHRDLKTDNVLIDKDFSVKIADFGMSKMIQKHSKTMTMSGTPAYLAPESISKGKFSEKSDVYSYGIVLWELHTEKRPFKGEEPYNIMYRVVNEDYRPTIPVDCSANYAALILSCWKTKPGDRPTFKEIIESLKTLNHDHGSRDLSMPLLNSKETINSYKENSSTILEVSSNEE